MNFTVILTSKPHNQHYLNRYIKIITHFLRNESKLGEIHHICPKSNDLFPEYKSLSKNKWNKVVLPHRVHFIVHWILHKAYKGKQTYAYIAMCNQLSPNKIKTKRVRPNSRWYKSARIEANKLISKANSKPNKKLSESMKGTVICKDVDGKVIRVTKQIFDENPNLVGIRNGIKNPDSHMKDDSHRARTSDVMSGRCHILNTATNERRFVKSKELDYYMSIGFTPLIINIYKKFICQKTCMHCKKTLDSLNYTRWHGNKCKFSPENINLLFL